MILGHRKWTGIYRISRIFEKQQQIILFIFSIPV